MHILNNGRLSLGTGSVGGSKWILDRIIRHVQDRKQFGLSLGEFELVQEKIGWMVSFTFGLESTAYLTTALVDAGIPDYSLESAILKVAGTEYLWYALNRALQLNGGQGYMRTEPYEKMLRDARIFPIFEGANDVMRAFIALTGIKPLSEELKALDQLSLSNRVESLGLLAGYVGSKIRRELRPDGITKAHEELKPLSDPVGDQVKQLREVSEKALREHKEGFMVKQFVQKRLADAVSDIYAQIAVLSRVTAIFEDQGVEPSGQEKYIAETFCARAAGRVRSNLDQVESNDDERMAAIAKLAYKRGEYGYALFD
jgi:acyl-CoA dehydrogenase family protein 9